jgi:Tol biopolymer transport system component
VSTRLSPSHLFTPPIRVSEVNSPNHDFEPCLSADELTLYFSSTRDGGVGGKDIWLAVRPDVASPFGEPTNVPELNTVHADGEAAISADDLTIYLSSQRPGAVGGVDIWVAERADSSLPFGPPINVAEVNSAVSDADPWISPDGLTLFLASDRTTPGLGSIWFATRAGASMPFAAPNLVSEVSSAEDDAAPSLGPDLRTLYLRSYRGGMDHTDIFVSTRDCP